jgi:hypothetical protein
MRRLNSGQYRVPDPRESYEQAIRFEHRDLPELSEFELWQEEELAKWALARTPGRDEFKCRWILERLAAVRWERQLRREFKRSRQDHV